MRKNLIDAFCDVVSLILIAVALNNFYLADHGIGIIEAAEMYMQRTNSEVVQVEDDDVQIQNIQLPSSEVMEHEHVWELTYQYDWVEHGDGTGHVTMKEILSCTCGISKPIAQVDE